MRLDFRQPQAGPVGETVDGEIAFEDSVQQFGLRSGEDAEDGGLFGRMGELESRNAPGASFPSGREKGPPRDAPQERPRWME